jgi:type II secretory pathway pseudopilin PulG
MVELLIATLFLAIGASSIVASVGITNKRAEMNHARAVALSIAKSEMEEYRMKARFKTLVVGSGSEVIPRGQTKFEEGALTDLGNTLVKGLPIDMTVTRTVAAVAGRYDLYSVTIQVTWSLPGKTGPATESVVLKTVLRIPSD